jgi:hypothetical protein
MNVGERADHFTVLIRDRAGQFTPACDAVLAAAGITVCKIPPRLPQRGRCRTFLDQRRYWEQRCHGYSGGTYAGEMASDNPPGGDQRPAN